MRVLGKLFSNSPGSLGAFAMYYGAQVNARGSSGEPKDVIARSSEFGTAIGNAIVNWSVSDQFDWTRQEPFKISREPGHWVPTGKAVAKLTPGEPFWGNLRGFAPGAQERCAPPPPEPFSRGTRIRLLQRSQRRLRDQSGHDGRTASGTASQR